MSAVLLAALQAAAATVSPICTDRPAKANAVCTVPAGRVQLESNLAAWTLTRGGGTRSEVLSVGASVFKLGLSDRSDLQVGVTPYLRLTARDASSRTLNSGFGDIQVRYKHRLTGDAANVQVAAIPFVKLPTASNGFGNGKVEGGLAIPISVAASKSVTVTFGPELDLLADADGSGRHLALVNLINVAAPIAPRLTVAGELWTNLNFDPAGTVSQVSADGALAYAASDYVQLDAGVNVGLTSSTPDVEIYAGISVRF